jgi:hypothetical protein
MSADLISIDEAAAQGIERLRMPKWVNRLDHIKLDVINGAAGPWLRLFSPFNIECNGRDPMPVLIFNFDTASKEYLLYSGALPDSEEYKAAQAFFKSCSKGPA